MSERYTKDPKEMTSPELAETAKFYGGAAEVARIVGYTTRFGDCLQRATQVGDEYIRRRLAERPDLGAKHRLELLRMELKFLQQRRDQVLLQVVETEKVIIAEGGQPSGRKVGCIGGCSWGTDDMFFHHPYCKDVCNHDNVEKCNKCCRTPRPVTEVACG